MKKNKLIEKAHYDGIKRGRKLQKEEDIEIIQECINKCNIKDCRVCENYKSLIKILRRTK